MRAPYTLAVAALAALAWGSPARAGMKIYSFPDLVAGTTIPSYSIDGFTISAADGFTVGSVQVIGPANTLIPVNDDPVTMTREDGNPWSLDIIAVVGSPLGTAGIISFTGLIGTLPYYELDVPVEADPRLLGNTLAFLNINSATWVGAGYQFSFIMVDYTPNVGLPGGASPEPSSWVLGLIGAGGVAGIRKMKRARFRRKA